MIMLDTKESIRYFVLLSIRGRLALTVQTGLGWHVPASRFMRAHFPGEAFPRTTAKQLVWLEDRIEAEYGPLEKRYTPRTGEEEA
jgi:hypothetical protein